MTTFLADTSNNLESINTTQSPRHTLPYSTYSISKQPNRPAIQPAFPSGSIHRFVPTALPVGYLNCDTTHTSVRIILWRNMYGLSHHHTLRPRKRGFFLGLFWG
jgi:hypothetical protein